MFTTPSVVQIGAVTLPVQKQHVGSEERVTYNYVQFLTEIKSKAEKLLNCEVKNALLTAPATYTNRQREAIKDSASTAGLNVARILNEVTAAAFLWGFRNKQITQKNILVFDLGARWAQASLAVVEDGICEVKAMSGAEGVGGLEIDKRLTEICGGNVSATEIEKAKIALSSEEEATVGEEVVITRSEFESGCADLFEKCLEPIERVLNDNVMEKEQIHEVVLVGGSSRIPKI